MPDSTNMATKAFDMLGEAMARPKPCDACSGSGRIHTEGGPARGFTCSACGGTGNRPKGWPTDAVLTPDARLSKAIETGSPVPGNPAQRAELSDFSQRSANHAVPEAQACYPRCPVCAGDDLRPDPFDGGSEADAPVRQTPFPGNLTPAERDKINRAVEAQRPLIELAAKVEALTERVKKLEESNGNR